MEVIDGKISISFNALQLWKLALPIIFSEEESVTVFSFSQFLKAPSPNVLILSVITISVIATQLSNANAPILSNPSLKVTVFRE